MEPESLCEGPSASGSASFGAASDDQDEDRTPDENDAMIKVLIDMGFPRVCAVEGLMHGGGTVTGAIDWIEARDKISDVEEDQGKEQASEIEDIKASGSENKATPRAADNKNSSLPTKKLSSVLPEIVPSELPDKGRKETLGRRKKIPLHSHWSSASEPEIFLAPGPSTAKSIRGAAFSSSGHGNNTAARPETVPVREPSMRSAAHPLLPSPFIRAAPRAGGTSNNGGSDPEVEEQEGATRIFADGLSNTSAAATEHTHEEGGANAQNQSPLDIRGNVMSDALSAYVASERGGGNRREQRGENEVTALCNAGMGVVANPDEGVYDGVAIEDYASEPPPGFLQKHCAVVGVTALCAVAVAIAATVAVMQKPSNSFEKRGEITDDQGNSVDAPLFTIHSQRFSSIKSFLQKQMDGSLAGDPTALNDEASPQWRALRWLAEEDARQVGLEDELSLTQRFALASLYYAAGGPGHWIRGSHFLSFNHECEWWETCNWLLPDRQCDEGERPTGILCSDNTTIDGLIFDVNNLTGTLPAEVGLLRSLRMLSLFGNEINGTIPLFLTKLQNLQFLFLHGNALTGPIPTQLGQLSNLQGLTVAFNSLTGSIPSELNALDNLSHVFLEENLLSGTLPFTNGSLPNIKQFGAGANTLTGATYSLCSLNTLVKIFLANNFFTGMVPTCLGNMSRLDVLTLEFNNFIGEIPSELSQLSELQILTLGINKLTGTVPAGLGNLTKLEFLSLTINQLTGLVPTSLVNLHQLEVLELHRNSFIGDLNFVCDMSPTLYVTADCHADDPHEDPEIMCSCCTSCCHDEVPGPDFIGCFPL